MNRRVYRIDRICRRLWHDVDCGDSNNVPSVHKSSIPTRLELEKKVNQGGAALSTSLQSFLLARSRSTVQTADMIRHQQQQLDPQSDSSPDRRVEDSGCDEVEGAQFQQSYPIRTLQTVVADYFVVSEEISLVCLLISFHSSLVRCEQVQSNRSQTQDSGTAEEDEDALKCHNMQQYASMSILASTLVVVAYACCSQLRRNELERRCEQDGVPKNTMTVSLCRFIGHLRYAALLAAVLRCIALLLWLLTPLCFLDAVGALSMGGFLLHLLACDYNYANARRRRQASVKVKLENGGSFSFKVAMFSTTILNSRLRSNSSSYVFIFTAAVLFSFYPTARHMVTCYSGRGQPSSALKIATVLAVTLGLGFATLVSLLRMMDAITFILMQCFTCIVVPMMRWQLQYSKEIIVGPWDIAHVSVVSGESR